MLISLQLIQMRLHLCMPPTVIRMRAHTNITRMLMRSIDRFQMRLEITLWKMKTPLLSMIIILVQLWILPTWVNLGLVPSERELVTMKAELLERPMTIRCLIADDTLLNSLMVTSPNTLLM